MEYAFTGEVPAWKKNLYWTVGIVLGLFSVFSFIVCVVMGAKHNYRHLFLAGDFVVMLGLAYVLYLFKKNDGGNINLAIGLMATIVLLSCVTMNLYAWQKVVNPNECGSNYYYPPDGKCYTACGAPSFGCSNPPPPPPVNDSPPAPASVERVVVQ